MKYLPGQSGLSHDTKPLSCSTGNRAKMLPKGHLSTKHYSQGPNITRSADSFSTVPSRVMGLTEDKMCDLETIIVLVLLTFSFSPHRSHHIGLAASSLFVSCCFPILFFYSVGWGLWTDRVLIALSQPCIANLF